MTIDLATPVGSLPFIGEVMDKRLSNLGIETAFDLLHHYPFRYDDFSLISKISDIQPGETVTIRGKVINISNFFTKYGKKIQRAKVADESGQINIVWYNQPFLVQNLKDQFVSISGKVETFQGKVVMESPEYEIVNNHNIGIHTGRLVPIYPETYGVSSKWLRNRIFFLLKNGLAELEKEYLPEELRQENNLVSLDFALHHVHFPASQDTANQARKRLAFNELFLIKLNSLIKKREWNREVVGKKFRIKNHELRIKNFVDKLPFKLTYAQTRCLSEIMDDLGQSKPMNRLLQGDVGSGKTVLAAMAIYLAYLNGYQSAFMAPTEILAFQHYQTLKNFFDGLNIKVSLLTSGVKTDKKVETDVFVGTHALLFKKINFKNLGLVVIDEQHRFGVEQRASLTQKGVNPHLLTMTATPIPRTVALALYGELDLSYLDEMPQNRQQVKTWLVPEEKRNSAYHWIGQKLKEMTGQAYWICPLIEESEKETMQSVKAATTEFTHLQKKVFPEFKLALLHGKMKSEEKGKILSDFASGKTDILVSTPVVEVGIDLANAIFMVIETAERFGLASLHQLRGRVGRGEKKSYCLLFTQSQSEQSTKRLKAMETIYNGAKLSEIDLKMRGPGDIYGLAQHGYLKLKIASLSDNELVRMVNKAAVDAINGLGSYAPLQAKLKSYTIRTVRPN